MPAQTTAQSAARPSFADIYAAAARDKACDAVGFEARRKARITRLSAEIVAEDALAAAHYSAVAA